MFEISDLKAKKLPELQDIAEGLKVPKFKTLKKLDLVYQILDLQATDPKVVAAVAPVTESTNVIVKERPKPRPNRERTVKVTMNTGNETQKVETAPKHPRAKKDKNEETKNVPNRREQHKTTPQHISLNKPQRPQKAPTYDKSNFDKDLKNRYKEPEFEFDSIIESEGVLDIMQDGYGFLRSSDYNYLSSPDDIYVSQSQIRLFGLKTGDTVLGNIRPPKEGEKYFPLIKVNKINGIDPQVVRDRVSFEHLTPLFPQEKFNIAERQSNISTRIIDLFAPIGKGQTGNDRVPAQNGKDDLAERCGQCHCRQPSRGLSDYFVDR